MQIDRIPIFKRKMLTRISGKIKTKRQNILHVKFMIFIPNELLDKRRKKIILYDESISKNRPHYFVIGGYVLVNFKS